jgi:hypothetical protein
MRMRDDYARNNRGKTTAHPRVPGEWKEVHLPFLPKNANKIPRGDIFPDWLRAYPDDDTPSRIQAEDGIEAGEEEEAVESD